MKPHLESWIGGGWDQLYAMFGVAGIMGSVCAATLGALVLILRFRLKNFFVMHSDHIAFQRKLEVEHTENLNRLAALEEQTSKLATRHSLSNVMQRQEILAQQNANLVAGQARMDAKIDGVAEGSNRVEHMMRLVLDHMLERDKA